MSNNEGEGEGVFGGQCVGRVNEHVGLTSAQLFCLCMRACVPACVHLCVH